MQVEPCAREALEDWVRLRQALWPQASEEAHRLEAAALLERPGGEAAAFLARNASGEAVGFAEATLRRDYVNGCDTSPVAFLEGIYVLSEWRRQGAARQLCRAVEAWAMGLGCAELASDAELANHVSHRMHDALGFEETERVVYFRKRLPPG